MTTADGIRATTTKVKLALPAVILAGVIGAGWYALGHASGGVRTEVRTERVPDLALALGQMEPEPAMFSDIVKYVTEMKADGDCLIYAPGEGVTLFTCKFAPAQ